jgi:hypothetical protein
VADVGEAEQLELRRSSRAEVSQRIAAIDDDRARAVGQRWCVAEDASDRDVNRAAYVSGSVLVRRESVDDLRAGGEHLEKFAMLNLAHALRAHRSER